MAQLNSATYHLKDLATMAAQAAAMLRHPRSRIRITPGWRAPSLELSVGGEKLVVHVSRRRISPLMWERLAHTPPPEDDLFLVTLTAEYPQWLREQARWMLADITRGAWVATDDQARESTWNALMSSSDLRRNPSEEDWAA